jgi:hypothetical protein
LPVILVTGYGNREALEFRRSANTLEAIYHTEVELMEKITWALNQGRRFDVRCSPCARKGIETTAMMRMRGCHATE